MPATISCQKHDDCRATREAVLRWMRTNADDYRDSLTGEVNLTTLAENAAWEFDHDEWLDDEQAEVWDLALEAVAPSAP